MLNVYSLLMGNWNWIKQRGNILKPKKNERRKKKTYREETKIKELKAETPSQWTRQSAKRNDLCMSYIRIFHEYMQARFFLIFFLFYVIFHTMPKWLVFYALHVVVVVVVLHASKLVLRKSACKTTQCIWSSGSSNF